MATATLPYHAFKCLTYLATLLAIAVAVNSDTAYGSQTGPMLQLFNKGIGKRAVVTKWDNSNHKNLTTETKIKMKVT